MGNRSFRGLRQRRPGIRHSPALFCGAGALGAAGSALLLAGVTTLAGAGVAGAEAAPTLGTAEAQVLQVTPHEGSLAVGAIMGLSLAGVTGDYARAQSEGADLGAIGIDLQAYNCGSYLPQAIQDLDPSPLTTESGDSGASQGITEGPNDSDYGANEHVQATTAPYSEADTTYGGPLNDPTGVLSVSGMVSKAWSGVVNGVDESGASVDISSLSLGAGTVVIDGLDWQSVYPTNGGGQPSGSFQIGKVTIGGVALPSLVDLSTVVSAINTALSALGMEIALPQSYVEQGVQYVDPLEIEVVPSTTRDKLLDSIVNDVQPYYYQVANGLENGFSSDNAPFNSLGGLEQGNFGQDLMYGVNVDGNQLPGLCDTDTPITLADITIASLDGGGYFNMALGGVDSSDAPMAVNPYNLTQLGLGNLTLPGTSTLVPGTPGTLGTAGTPPPSPSTPTTSNSTAAAHQAVTARLTGFSPGGPLLAAALGAVGLLVLLVEGDRRLMRRAQRAAARGDDHRPTAAPEE